MGKHHFGLTIGQKQLMKTIDAARSHYRFVGEGIKRCVADDEDLFMRVEFFAASYHA